MEDSKKPSRRHKRPVAPQAPEQPPPWWLKQLQDRPFQIVSVLALTVGGLVTLTFFAQRRIFPDLDLKSATAALFAVAAVAALMFLGLTACAIGGGLVLRGPGRWSKFFATPKNLLWLAAPGWGTVALASVAWEIDPGLRIPGWTWFLPFVAAAGISWRVSGKADFAPGGDQPTAQAERWARAQAAVGFFGYAYLWICVGAGAGMTFWIFRSPDASPRWLLFGAAAWVTLCYATNMAVASAKLTKLRELAAALLGCCAISMATLLFLTDNWTGFPGAVMRVLTLGETPVALVLDEDGCDEINQASGAGVCRMAPGAKKALVCPALMRSRVGSPYFVEVSRFAADGTWPKEQPPTRMSAIALDRGAVKSWTRIAPMQAASAPHARASDAVATYLDPSQTNAWMREQCGPAPSSATAPSGAAGPSAPIKAPAAASSGRAAGG